MTFKWKLVVGFVLAFLAGCATGAFLAASHSHHLHNLALHRSSLADRMRQRIQTQLDLTPAQLEEIGPIFNQAANELQKIRTETGAHVRQVIAETDRALAPHLTPDQRKKLELMEQESRAQSGRQGAGRRCDRREPQDETNPGN